MNQPQKTRRQTRDMVVLAMFSAILFLLAFTNTILVMGMIFLVFRQAYATMGGIPADTVLGVILGIAGTDGVLETITAAVIAPAVCLFLTKALRLEPLPVALVH